MPDKKEEDERRRLRRAMKADLQARERALMPISQKNLEGLFDFLDRAVGAYGCDNTTKMTREYLSACGLDTNAILPWLGQHGGFCDCEILANVEER